MMIAHDTVAKLARTGRLDYPRYRAALEIAMIFQAITAGSATVTTRYQRSGRIGAEAADDLADVWHTVYLPWADECDRVVIAGRRTLFALTVDAAVEQRGLSELARAYRIGVWAVPTLLERSLGRYAQRAGWIDPAPRVVIDRRPPGRVVRALDALDAVRWAGLPPTAEALAAARAKLALRAQRDAIDEARQLRVGTD
jgi:hypothetical protein